MGKKLKGHALSKFEAKRDVWQEVLDGVREIKSGGGKRSIVPTQLYDTEKVAGAHKSADSLASERDPNRARLNIQKEISAVVAARLRALFTTHYNHYKNRRRNNGSAVLYRS